MKLMLAAGSRGRRACLFDTQHMDLKNERETSNKVSYSRVLMSRWLKTVSLKDFVNVSSVKETHHRCISLVLVFFRRATSPLVGSSKQCSP